MKRHINHAFISLHSSSLARPEQYMRTPRVWDTTHYDSYDYQQISLFILKQSINSQHNLGVALQGQYEWEQRNSFKILKQIQSPSEYTFWWKLRDEIWLGVNIRKNGCALCSLLPSQQKSFHPDIKTLTLNNDNGNSEALLCFNLGKTEQMCWNT